MAMATQGLELATSTRDGRRSRLDMGVLPAEALDAVEAALQPTLYDLLALELTTKQAHWNVIGRNFRSLHKLLDEVYTFVAEKSDEVAERLVALGISADGQPRELASSATVLPVPQGFLKDAEVSVLMEERIAAVARGIRERAGQVSEADPVTEDIMLEIVAELEKYHWMLRASEE